MPFGCFICEGNGPVSFLFQRISRSIRPRLRKDGKRRWKPVRLSGSSKRSPSGKLLIPGTAFPLNSFIRLCFPDPTALSRQIKKCIPSCVSIAHPRSSSPNPTDQQQSPECRGSRAPPLGPALCSNGSGRREGKGPLSEQSSLRCSGRASLCVNILDHKAHCQAWPWL